MENNKKIPTGVKILSVLDYIAAVLLLIIGLLSFFVNIAALSVLGVFVGIIGVIFIVLGVVEFFVARGLWKGQNWARVITIIFSIFGLIFGLISLVGGGLFGIIEIVIDLIIGGYLIFNNNVKVFFSKS